MKFISAIIDNKCIRATLIVPLIVTWNTHLVSGFRESEKDLFWRFYQDSLNANYLKQFVRDNLENIGIASFTSTFFPLSLRKDVKK